MALHPLLLSLATALASPPPELALPGSSAAFDDGPESLPVNPATFAFDPDPAYALLYGYALEGGDSSFSFQASAGGLGTGIAYADALDGGTWTLSTGLGLRLPDDWSLGTRVAWHLPAAAEHYTSWNLGVAWRPLAWLGIGAAARELGESSAASYALAATARPFGDLLAVSLDGRFLDDGDWTPEPALSLVLRPLEGLELRAFAAERLDGGRLAAGGLSAGGGLTVYFGEAGAGAFGSTGPEGEELVAAVRSATPRRRLLGARRRVPLLRVDSSYPYHPAPSFYGEQREQSYLQLVKGLHEAARDPGVRGLVLELHRLPFSFGQLSELRQLLTGLREAGKPVVVVLDEAASNGAYYLATAADRIYLHPSAELGLVGLSAELTFYRGTLDLLGVEPQFARRGEYKSAVEQFTRSEPSGPASEQMSALLDDLQDELLRAVAEGRGISVERVRELVDGGPYTAREAVDAGLADGVVYGPDLEDTLGESGLFPDDFELDDEGLGREGNVGWRSPRRVAVVVVDGTIVSGRSSPPGLLGGGTSGSRTICRALEQAREDPTVKAVVLRVDSPGGSAFASDDIWKGVRELQEAGKPVVVSMGGVAASGGYYVSAGADAIVAEPTTITGSIGVFGGKFSFEGLYEKLGLSSTLYARGRRAGMWSPSRPFDAVEAAALDHLVAETYRQFKEKVAEGRGLSPDAVEEVARGRVWSGRAALQHGLVDELGGLYDAVELAREKAGIPEGARVELVTYGNRPNPLGELPTTLLRATVGPLEPTPALSELAGWSALGDEHLFLLMPYNLEVR